MKRILLSLSAVLLGFGLGAPAQPTEVAEGVIQLGTFQDPNITESSGVTSSHRNRSAFWTHNDGGDPILFGFSTNGTELSEWTIQGFEARDWEDIASRGRRIYIADIGNDHGDPGQIYLVAEPNPKKSGNLRVLKRFELTYPDHPFNAEAFFISRGRGYIIEKEGGNAHVYTFKFFGRTAGQLQRQCSLNIHAPATSADITKDNRRLAVLTEAGAYLFELRRQVPAEGTLEPTLFVPYDLPSMEGCTFTRDGLLVTAETGEILLFTNPLFRSR